MTEPAIAIRQLSKRFGKREALAPIDLDVPRGAIFALAGHNGAGKTTLLKLLLNLIEPSGGSIDVLGAPVAKLKGEAFTRVGYIAEDQPLPDWMTVRQIMDFLRPLYPRWDERGLLESLDLPPDRKLKHLSRGMRMKAALASVLAFRPPLILMDEPFSGLDPLVRDELIQTLLDRVAEDGETTVVISSHDLAEIETLATHVAFLDGGRLLFAEEMPTLTSRFREVTIQSAAESTSMPSTWLVPERSGSVLRFTYTAANSESVDDTVQAVLPGATILADEPMPLRSIFLALAKLEETDRKRQGSAA